MIFRFAPTLPALFLCVTTLFAAESAARPNVLLIVTDDQGFGDLSIHGNPYLKTPHIDNLGASGIRFDRFYVNSFCAPTRAGVLTGRYPVRCGVWGVTHNKEAMRTEEITLGEAFGSAGYRTGYIGKWHNGGHYPYTPRGQGFDDFFGFCAGHWNDYFAPTLLRGDQPVKTKGYITDVLTDEAIRFITAEPATPFFCYLSYNAPHSPYQVPDRYYEKFDHDKLGEAAAAFYGMCENIDDNVGRLVKVLEQAGLRENTIVLFLTDNGGTAGVKHYNAGMRGGKTRVHEGGCRVPLFLNWPARFTNPREIPQIAAHVDLLPTLLDLCEITRADGPPMDGTSLRPLLEGNSEDWPERILFTHNPISKTNRYPGAVRTQQYRLVREIKGPQGGSSAVENDESAGPWQLYDMLADPGEKHDLANKRPDIVAELSAKYEVWYDDTISQELTRLPIPVGYDQHNPVMLAAHQVYVSGPIRFAHGPGFAHDWLTNWTDTQARIWYDVDIVQPGTYSVSLQYACPASDAGSTIEFETSAHKLKKQVSAGDAPRIPLSNRDQRSNERYENRDWAILPMGEIQLDSGRQTLTLRASNVAKQQVLELKGIILEKK